MLMSFEGGGGMNRINRKRITALMDFSFYTLLLNALGNGDTPIPNKISYYMQDEYEFWALLTQAIRKGYRRVSE